MRKTILLFVFNGFADWETSYALTGILQSNAYQIKTIALERNLVTTLSGLCVFPDLDFRPNVDLPDIDNTNTAMIILPGGSAWHGSGNEEVQLLIRHSIKNFIPIAAAGNSLDFVQARFSCCQGENFDQHIITSNTTAIEFAKAIFEALNICEDAKLECINSVF